MAVSMRNVDSAFHTISHKPGLQIWRMRSGRPDLLPKSEHGKFFTQDCYLILRTKALRNGALHFDLHYWLGKETSEDEADAAALKTVELDAALGGRAVQYREAQGHETDLFLSYFKPCIIPLQGSAGQENVDGSENKPCLYLCKGKRIARVEQVPFARSSLSHTGVFILNTEDKVFQFNGEASSIQERARALDVVQYIVDKNHGGKCEVIIIDDGRLGDERNTGQFWGLFGGFAPFSKKGSSDEHRNRKSTALQLFCIPAGGDAEEQKLQAEGLQRDVLQGNKCYVLVCDSEMYVWIGRATALDHRKTAALYAEKKIRAELPAHTSMAKFIEGFETSAFRLKFQAWPQNDATTVAREGRGKITALLQQQTVVRTSPQRQAAPVKEEPLPVPESHGKTEIWRVSGDSKTPVPPEEYGRFFSSNCYIVQHTTGHRKEEIFVYSWIGQHSSPKDQKVVVELSSKIAHDLKGRAVLGRAHEGKEHAHFLSLFGPMVVLKGGPNGGSVENESEVEHNLLFEVRGSGPSEMYAIQVEAVAESLNSSKSFILQTESKVFIWHGGATTTAQQKVALKVVEKLKAGIASKILKEGSETPIFWKILQGKRTRASIPGSVDHEKDPRLFVCTSTEGRMFSEILNFDQDDLLSDDVLILDTPYEVVTWVGHSCTLEQKLNAKILSQGYIDHAVATENLSPSTPLYQVSEGHEPPFFTRWFTWSAAKASAQLDPYNSKLSSLQGHSFQDAKHNVRRGDPGATDFDGAPNSSEELSSGPSQRSAALAGLANAMKAVDSGHHEPAPRETGSTQRAAAMAALSSVWNSPPASKATQGSSPEELRSQDEMSPRKDGDKPGNLTLKQLSQRAAAVAALSTVLHSSPDKPRQGQPESGGWIVVSPEINADRKIAPNTDLVLRSKNSVNNEVAQEDFEVINSGESPDKYFPLSQLTVGSSNPASDIDATRRESYLRPNEFEQLFGMSKNEFYELPRWKQALRKKHFGLF